MVQEKRAWVVMEMGHTPPFPCNKRSRLRVLLEPLPSLKLLTGSRSSRQGTTSSTRVAGTKVVVFNTECEGRISLTPPNHNEITLVTFLTLSHCPLVCIYRLFFANADRALASRILSFIERHPLFLASLCPPVLLSISPFLLNINRHVLFTNMEHTTGPSTPETSKNG